MSTVLGAVVGIVGLGFLILVHELGHFTVAKATGMRVEEFSIGYGRFLFSRLVGETVYGISILPIGGYVRVTGMHQEEFAARQEAARTKQEALARDPEAYLTGSSAISDEEVANTPLARRYYAKPLWQRLLFIVSGVTMNIIVAFLMLVVVGLQGLWVPTTQIQEVVANSPAAVAGVAVGDTVVSLAGRDVDSWADLQEAIRANPGNRVPLVVERDGERLTLTATLGVQEGGGFLGVGPAAEKRPVGVGQAFNFALDRTWNLFTLLFREIGKLVTGESPVTGSGGLAGPVGIVAISSSAFQEGYYLSLLAFISIQLGVLNMLPLLPLDGGHFLINILQSVTRRTFSLRTFERISMVGLGLFLLLALVATGNDIGRLVTGTWF
ncbi:MAG: site-2 protease family protein [Actinobacteria bacterium]|nr:site-2 protease family protein [Actinomycetota bacterium]